MDTMPINFVVLCSMPEAMIIMYTGLYLLGLKPSVKRVIIAGILQGIASYFIRKYTGYGVHIIYQALTLIFLTITVVKIKPLCSIFSSLIGISLNILVESAYLMMALGIGNYTYAEVLSRDWLRVIFTTPKQIILLLIIGILVKNQYTLEEEFQFIEKINGEVEL